MSYPSFRLLEIAVSSPWCNNASQYLPTNVKECYVLSGLGFNIRGGTDNMHVGKDSGIFVTTVKPNGAASKDRRLQPGDKILEV